MEHLGELGGGPGAVLGQALLQGHGDTRAVCEVRSGARVVAAHRHQPLGGEVVQAAADGGQAATEVLGDLGYRPASRRQEQHLHPVALGRRQGGIAPQRFHRGALVGGEGES
jgi:hypothetical protein